MKRKIFRVSSLVILLLLIVVPATPVMAAPTIVLSPTSGGVGTKVTVTGTNFTSYAGDNLSIFFNETEISSSPVTVPGTGDFKVTFNIPASSQGTALVTVKGTLGSILAKASFNIQPTEITLKPVKGTVGTVVAVQAKGFTAGKAITLYLDTEKLTTETASDTGECNFNLTIPESTAGKHKLIAEGSEGNLAETEFDIIPSITVKPTSAAAGDTISIKGTGFGYKTEVSIDFETAEIGRAVTNKNGSFDSTFKIPALKSHTYEINAEDEDGNTAQTEFTITAGASISPNTGAVGMELTVKGIGFTGGNITIKYDALQVATATTDNAGAFTAKFNIPVSTKGNHMVTASDGVNTKQIAFAVESEPPQVPEPLLPKSGDKVKSPVSFDWKDVTDPSLPVTYQIQVALDNNFSSTILEKKDITESDYILSKEERLQPNKEKLPYYWRVRAVDGASNESEWSAPKPFFVSSSLGLPGWLVYTLVGVGALVAGYLLFRLGRRTAYY